MQRGKKMGIGKFEDPELTRDMVYKEDGQEYAMVLRMLGYGECEAMCVDNVKRICYYPDHMLQKVSFGPDDILLVALRASQDDKADVILKYTPKEVFLLRAFQNVTQYITKADGSIEFQGVMMCSPMCYGANEDDADDDSEYCIDDEDDCVDDNKDAANDHNDNEDVSTKKKKKNLSVKMKMKRWTRNKWKLTSMINLDEDDNSFEVKEMTCNVFGINTRALWVPMDVVVQLKL